MRIRLSIVLILFLTIVLNGCIDKGSVENESSDISNRQEKAEKEQGESDYSRYKGAWNIYMMEEETFTALEPALGRTAIDILEIDNNKIVGEITSVSGGPSFRMAEISFEGEVVDGKLISRYEDKDWEYKGELSLEFEEDYINANISRDEAEPRAMWGIPEGEFKFKRPIATEMVELNDEEKLEIEAVVDVLEEENLYPEIKILLQNTEDQNIYYAYIDYKRYNEEQKSDIIYQHLIILEKVDQYRIKETKLVEYPLEFDLIMDFLDN